MRKKLILASASPRRKELLTQAGFDFQILAANADENITEKEAEQMVQMLSEMPLNELKALPKDMIKFAKSLIGTGILPSEVEIKLSNM